MIVDLAVEDHADPTGRVPHRLSSALDVDNGKTPMAQKNRRFVATPETGAVRPAMRQRVGHRVQIGRGSEAREAGDPAHVSVQPGSLRGAARDRRYAPATRSRCGPAFQPTDPSECS